MLRVIASPPKIRLRKSQIIETEYPGLKTAAGTPLRWMGLVKIKIRWKSHTVKIEYYVISGPITHLILSEDTITTNNLCKSADLELMLEISGLTVSVRLPKQKDKDNVEKEVEEKKARGKAEAEAEEARRRTERARLDDAQNGPADDKAKKAAGTTK